MSKSKLKFKTEIIGIQIYFLRNAVFSILFSLFGTRFNDDKPRLKHIMKKIQ